MSQNVDVPRVVRTLLAYNDRNQADLAPVLGVAVPTVSKLLAGSRPFSVDEIYKLAEFFEVPYNILMDDPSTLVRSRWFLQDLVPA